MTNKELEKRIDELEDTVEMLKDKLRIIYIQTKKEEPEDKKPKHEFKVGGRVQFKSWEEMEKEFGVDRNGRIKLDERKTYPGIILFTPDMEYLCGTYATISKIDGHKVELKDFTARGDNSIWTYSLDMLKPATDEPKCKFKVGDKVRFTTDNGNEFEGTIYDILENKYKVLYGMDFLGEEMFTYIEFNNIKKQKLEIMDKSRCKFAVGDRVKQVNLAEPPHFGDTGTIKSIQCSLYKPRMQPIYMVKFDNSSSVQYSEQLENNLEPYTEPRWTFTEDEKVILRNLDVDYKWIARDRDGILCAYFTKPRKLKSVDMWDCDTDDWCLAGFNHLFQSIKWNDEQPCEFRKYL